jgi:hypothetical protein
VGNHLGKLLPLEVEFGEIVLEGGTLKQCLFMKKDKLARGTILLNVIDIILHHVAQCVETIKDAWDNLCATFERTYVGNKLLLCQELYNLKMGSGRHLSASSY